MDMPQFIRPILTIFSCFQFFKYVIYAHFKKNYSIKISEK